MRVLLITFLITFVQQLRAQDLVAKDSAEYFYKAGQYAKGLPFAVKSYQSYKDRNITDSFYISSAYTLGSMYFGLGKHDSALVYFEKASEGTKIEHGDTSYLYAKYMIEVGVMNRELGKFSEAEAIFKSSIAILEKADVPLKNDFAFVLIHYGMLCFQKGNLKKAEELYLKAKSIAPQEPIEYKTEYALSLHELAKVYARLSLYKKQEQVQLEVVQMLEEMFGVKHPAYGSAVSNLGTTYHRQRKMEAADSMYRKALDIKIEANGVFSPANIMTQNNLGTINEALERYDVAEKYFLANLEIVLKNGGEETLQYPFCLRSLANLYFWMGRKDEADKLYHKSLAIYDKLGVERNSTRHRLLYDMARHLYGEDSVNATYYLNQAILLENQLLLEKVDFLSEAELINYVQGLETASARPYMFLLKYNSPIIRSAAYNSLLLSKGIGLQNSKFLYNYLEQSPDTILAKQWATYQQQKSDYTNLMLTPVKRRSINSDSMANALIIAEKEILRKSEAFRVMKSKLLVSWEDIKKTLKPNETSIEFVKFSYRYDLYERVVDTIYYAALVIRPEDAAPQFINLFEEKELEAVMRKFAYKGSAKVRANTESYGQVPNNTLYKLLWQPLEPYLKNTNTIYFSPDGLLHQIAFAAIPYSKGKLLCDQYQLIQLSSTRELLNKSYSLERDYSAAMFGGVNYSNNEVVPTLANDNGDVFRGNRSLVDSFSYLPHSLQEVNQLKKRSEGYLKSTKSYTGAAASETALRALQGAQSPEIIHFATHGFTLPIGVEAADESFKVADNPLLRCGLVLSGGNRGWKGEVDATEDDGILTGLEISTLRLSNTKLVVLSACETGLGKIEGSEGVFGLQRAFKLAGADYIMASLWQVPDKETAVFMDTFYTQLFKKGVDIRTAFTTTQQIMRKKYSPYYWAAFTLVQ